MLKVRFSALAVAGAFVVLIHPSHAATFQENFSSDPAARGWQAIGDGTLFQWNSTNGNVEATWDSSHSNSYFCYPLGTVLAKDDDFSFAFDLQLRDFAAGVNPLKPNPFELSVGLLNLSDATKTNFARGTGDDSPNLVEFSFFPDPGGDWIWGPSLTSTIADANATNYNHWYGGGFAGLALTSNDVYHIELVYTASNQTLHTSMTCNGAPFGPMPDAVAGSDFTDFRVDHIAICSYSDALQDPYYAGSILAHGTVDNFTVTLPPAPVSNVSGRFSDGAWQVEFESRTNWLYTLESTKDLRSWTDVSATTAGTGGTLVLSDTNALAPNAFYRIRANRP